MKAFENLSIYSRLTERRHVLKSAIGRPRTALWIGGSEGSAYAEEVGARVERRDGAKGSANGARAEAFDLAFVTGARVMGDLADTLASEIQFLGATPPPGASVHELLPAAAIAASSKPCPTGLGTRASVT